MQIETYIYQHITFIFYDAVSGINDIWHTHHNHIGNHYHLKIWLLEIINICKHWLCSVVCGTIRVQLIEESDNQNTFLIFALFFNCSFICLEFI